MLAERSQLEEALSVAAPLQATCLVVPKHSLWGWQLVAGASARAGRRYKALDASLSLLHLLAKQNKGIHKYKGKYRCFYCRYGGF